MNVKKILLIIILVTVVLVFINEKNPLKYKPFNWNMAMSSFS